MSTTRNVMVKINNAKREIWGRDINAHEKVKLRHGSQRKGKGERRSPIDNHMRAMVQGNVRRRGKQTRPGRVSKRLVARDTCRVRIGAKGSGDSPRGLLNQDTIRLRSGEKRKKSSMAFTEVNGNDGKG